MKSSSVLTFRAYNLKLFDRDKFKSYLLNDMIKNRYIG